MKVEINKRKADPIIAKRYLGITDSELESSYDLLDF